MCTPRTDTRDHNATGQWAMFSWFIRDKKKNKNIVDDLFKCEQ